MKSAQKQTSVGKVAPNIIALAIATMGEPPLTETAINLNTKAPLTTMVSHTHNHKGAAPMENKEAPKCPSCGSKQVLFRITKGFICRRCGHEFQKPK